MHLVTTGIQGCGKGTQARLLKEKYGFEIVEMGQEFRSIIASGSVLGKKLKEVMDAGYLVNEDLGSEVMKEVIKKYKNYPKVVFDAFIRLPWNKTLFDEYLPSYKVVFFNISIEKAKSRLLGRIYDEETGETFPFGIIVNPKTGNKLVKRDDDKDEISILKRISEFENKTLPIVELQKQELKVVEINADQSVEDVFAEIEKKLNLKI